MGSSCFLFDEMLDILSGRESSGVPTTEGCIHTGKRNAGHRESPPWHQQSIKSSQLYDVTQPSHLTKIQIGGSWRIIFFFGDVAFPPALSVSTVSCYINKHNPQQWIASLAAGKKPRGPILLPFGFQGASVPTISPELLLRGFIA